MAVDLIFIATSFAAVFAIVNPLGATSFFVVLTQDYPRELKKRVIQKAVLAATVTLILFAFGGFYIFSIFGTTLPAFEVAGGILLLALALGLALPAASVFGRSVVNRIERAFAHSLVPSVW